MGAGAVGARAWEEARVLLSRLFPAYDPVDAALAVAMIAAGVLACALLILGVTAPYGKHARRGWGWGVDARVAWFTQEVWSLAIPAALVLPRWVELPAWPRACAAGFLAHYVQRSIVYPLRMPAGAARMPAGVWLMCVAFCIWNGVLQGRLLSVYLPRAAPGGAQAAAGAALFLAGMAVNLHSDGVLRKLRQGAAAGGTGRGARSHYRIPRGGMFEYVSGANFLGEIVEWAGYATACGWALPAAAFAAFTACNIGPRALHHHRWYLDRFRDEYPRLGRKALIPFVL